MTPRRNSCSTGLPTRSAAVPIFAIFISLALGYYFGIGQLGITIAPPLKATFILSFLFAIVFGVGPQFVRGIAKDGLRQTHLVILMT